MVEILIYITDRDDEGEIKDFFGDDFNVKIARSMNEAIKDCTSEWFDLILVCPADYENTKVFLNALREVKLSFLPVVALIDNKDELRKITSLDVADYIILPLPREEFYTLVNQILTDLDFQSTVMEGMNWQGSLEEYNLLDLIQMIDESQKDAELVLSCLGNSAALFFRKGKLVHASLADLSGEAVLHKLIFWSKGNFHIRFSRKFSVSETIQSNNQELLLMVAHDLSEWDQNFRGLPDLNDKIVVNPLIESTDISSFQKDIIKKCRNPVSLFELFLKLAEDNKTIIHELKTLMEKVLIGKEREIELLIEQEKQRSGFRKILSAFSTAFKKQQDFKETQRVDESLGDKDFTSRIEFKQFYLEAEDKEKIIKKIDILS